MKSWVRCWHVKLCDPLLTRTMPERLRGKRLIIKHYTNRAYLYLHVSKKVSK